MTARRHSLTIDVSLRVAGRRRARRSADRTEHAPTPVVALTPASAYVSATGTRAQKTKTFAQANVSDQKSSVPRSTRTVAQARIRTPEELMRSARTASPPKPVGRKFVAKAPMKY